MLKGKPWPWKGTPSAKENKTKEEKVAFDDLLHSLEENDTNFSFIFISFKKKTNAKMKTYGHMSNGSCRGNIAKSSEM